MSRSFCVEDPRGTRDVGESDFPLSVGGPEADIQLPGVDGSEPVAWIGLTDGQLFVQAAGSVPVACNGTPVTTSHWLDRGDLIRIGLQRLEVAVADGATRFVVQEAPTPDAEEDAPRIVRAPDAAKVAAEGTAVKPVAFKPSRETRIRRPKRKFRAAIVASWLIIVLLAVGGWFLVTARPVEVRIEPAPDSFEIEGVLLGLELGGRQLLRPGPHRVTAIKEGYHPLDTEVEVTTERNQVIRLQMELLPGLLTITSPTQTPSRVLIDGEEIGTAPLESIELARGEYQVRVQAERYHDFVTQVVIEGGGVEQTLTAEPAAAWAEISFDSAPRGARVRVDGEEVGRTPLTVELLEGTRRVDYRLEGYKSFGHVVKVVARQPQKIPAVDLALPEARLALDSRPTGATVRVDGEYRGETPLELLLKPGQSHEIGLSRTGHEPEKRQVRLGSGEVSQLEVELAPKLGRVQLQVDPAGSTVFVDGENRGSADRTLELAAVPHQIEIRHEGYLPFQTTVTPRPGFPQSISVKLETAEQIQVRKTPPRIRTSEGHELVLIKEGKLVMGAPRREPGRRANETERVVELTRPFYMATQEISNEQFRRFRNSHVSGRAGSHNLEIDHHPVVRVTWDAAAEYCNWLSSRESLPPAYISRGGTMVAISPMTTGYRLPTEAEWAFVARYREGEEPLKYPWGDAMPVVPDSGNYADESASGLINQVLGGYDDNYPATSPVDAFMPDPRGLFNLGGNVAEWMHDFYTVYRLGAEEVQKDPAGPASGDYHVIRGSSWMDSSVSKLRLTYRDYGLDGRPDLGFRVARYAE